MFYALAFLRMDTKTTLNTLRTKGWMKNSWLSQAKGKLKHTSLLFLF